MESFLAVMSLCVATCSTLLQDFTAGRRVSGPSALARPVLNSFTPTRQGLARRSALLRARFRASNTTGSFYIHFSNCKVRNIFALTRVWRDGRCEIRVSDRSALLPNGACTLSTADRVVGVSSCLATALSRTVTSSVYRACSKGLVAGNRGLRQPQQVGDHYLQGEGKYWLDMQHLAALCNMRNKEGMRQTPTRAAPCPGWSLCFVHKTARHS